MTSVSTWLFDVDGTLTPSRASMRADFRDWFLRFTRANTVCLVTGSDYGKTVEQVGPEILAAVHTSFNCMGNSIWRAGVEVAHAPFGLPAEVETHLLTALATSPYPVRTGLHIERRRGMVNFSVVGRNAVHDQRRAYYEWDLRHNERRALSQALENAFPGLSCQIAGETGLDIFPRGRDKSQVLERVQGPVRFFGDRMDVGGNDHSLAAAIERAGDGSRAHPVRDFEHTWELLRDYEHQGLLSLA